MQIRSVHCYKLASGRPWMNGLSEWRFPNHHERRSNEWFRSRVDYMHVPALEVSSKRYFIVDDDILLTSDLQEIVRDDTSRYSKARMQLADVCYIGVSRYSRWSRTDSRNSENLRRSLRSHITDELTFIFSYTWVISAIHCHRHKNRQ